MSTSHVHHLWVLKPVAGVSSWCKHPATSDEMHEVEDQLVYHSKNHIDDVIQYALVSFYPHNCDPFVFYYDAYARPMQTALPSHFTVLRVHDNWQRTHDAEAQAAHDAATDPLPMRQPLS